MAGTPRVPQGNLNRLRGSLIIPNFASLNITAPFLGKQGLSIAFKGPATTRLPTMTGGVNSPEVYREVTITAHCVKSQAMAAAWKLQEETNTLLGDGLTFRSDASPTLPPFQFDNCSLDGVQGVTANGMDPDYVVVLGGFWYINSDLWN